MRRRTGMSKEVSYNFRYMKLLLTLTLLFIAHTAFCGNYEVRTFGFSNRTYIVTDSTKKDMQLKKYAQSNYDAEMNALICKRDKNRAIFSGVITGAGAVCLGGGIGLTVMLAKHDYPNNKYTGIAVGAGILMTFGVIYSIAGPIGLTANLKKIKQNCTGSALYFTPGLNGLTFAYRF